MSYNSIFLIKSFKFTQNNIPTNIKHIVESDYLFYLAYWHTRVCIHCAMYNTFNNITYILA